MLESFDALKFAALHNQSSGMSRVPWPPQQSPPSFAFPTPPSEQYGAPGNPALCLPNYTPFMPPPGGWARLPSPPPANVPPPQIPGFVNPRVIARPQFQAPSYPFVHTDANFSYGGNYRAPHALPGTTGSVPTVIAPALDDPSVCPGVLPFIKADIVRPEDGKRSAKVEEIDVCKAISNMRGLISKAEDTVSQILKLLNVKPDPSRSYPAFLSSEGLHGMPAEMITHRFLTHSLPPKGLKSDVEALSTDSKTSSSCQNLEMSCTRVPRPSGIYDANDVQMRVSSMEIPEKSEGRLTQSVESSELFYKMLKNLKNECGLSDEFLYKDAPSVVQVPALHHVITSDLPGFVNTEKWAELASWEEFEGEIAHRSDVCKVLSPSRYWLLKKELASWKGLPLKYTSTQLEVAVALIRVRRTDLRNWLLIYLPSFGVLPDRVLANHVLSLLMLCLRAVYREAAMISARMSASKYKDTEIPPDKGSSGWNSAGGQYTVKDATRNFYAVQGKASFLESPSIECKTLFESGCWLSSQLSPLCDVSASQNLVLCLFKQALEDAAYHLAFQLPQPGQMESDVRDLASNGPRLGKGSESLPEAKDEKGPFDDSSVVGEGVLSLRQIAEAIVAIQEQAALKQSRKAESDFFNSSRSHRSAVHNSIVIRAEEERATRTNYRAVLEHDGLAWQRSNQNYKKNKTREEILAEERDYKRRRMSYRGKKLQRTPVQVLRDIIGSHMEDIVAAGGIGCFGKRLQDLPASEMETECVKGDDGVTTGSKEQRDAQETNNSSELQNRGSKASHLEGNKFSKFGSRDSYEHNHSDEKRRQDSRRSISVSYSTSNHAHHGHDRYYSHGQRQHDRHERSSYGSSDHHSFHREHDSERKYDRWESKLEEEREEHRRSHGDGHRSRHHSRAHDQGSHL